MSSSLTFFNISAVVSMRLWYRNGFQNFVDHLFHVDILRFCFIGKSDAVAQNIFGNGSDVLGYDIAALAKKGVGLGGKGEVNTGPGAATIGNERLQLFQLVFFGSTGGKNDIQDIVFDL